MYVCMYVYTVKLAIYITIYKLNINQLCVTTQHKQTTCCQFRYVHRMWRVSLPQVMMKRVINATDTQAAHTHHSTDKLMHPYSKSDASAAAHTPYPRGQNKPHRWYTYCVRCVVNEFCRQLTKTYVAEMSCSQLLLMDWLCYVYAHQDLFTLPNEGPRLGWDVW